MLKYYLSETLRYETRCYSINLSYFLFNEWTSYFFFIDFHNVDVCIFAKTAALFACTRDIHCFHCVHNSDLAVTLLSIENPIYIYSSHDWGDHPHSARYKLHVGFLDWCPNYHRGNGHTVPPPPSWILCQRNMEWFNSYIRACNC